MTKLEAASSETMTEREAARYIGMSLSFIRVARIRKQAPTYVKVGRSVRYLVSDLDAFLRVRRVLPAASADQGKSAGGQKQQGVTVSLRRASFTDTSRHAVCQSIAAMISFIDTTSSSALSRSVVRELRAATALIGQFNVSSLEETRTPSREARVEAAIKAAIQHVTNLTASSSNEDWALGNLVVRDLLQVVNGMSGTE